MLGGGVASTLRGVGYEVLPLTRGRGEFQWNPPLSGPSASVLKGVEAVVHLAGENIGARRWTHAQKQELRESRVKGTALLCHSLAAMETPPHILVSASAVGIYGDRGEEILHEESAHGSGFLAELADDWERATESASKAGVRVVHLRFGMVLDGNGGALAKMRLPFRCFVGGRMGSGRQWWSWVTLHDAAKAVLFVLQEKSLSGAVNVTANADTNEQFTKTLGGALRRPTIFPLPAFVARIVLGEMADGLLLASTRVESRKLRDAGFEFKHARLEPALRDLLGG